MPVPPGFTYPNAIIPLGPAVEVLYAITPHTEGATQQVALKTDEKAYLWNAGFIELPDMEPAQATITVADIDDIPFWIHFNGVRWNFIQAGYAHTEDYENYSEKGATVEETLTNLVNAISISTHPTLSLCDYTLVGTDTLKISYKKRIKKAEQFAIHSYGGGTDSSDHLVFPTPTVFGTTVTLTKEGAQGLQHFREQLRYAQFYGQDLATHPLAMSAPTVPPAP